jgi:hypothetical protein
MERPSYPVYWIWGTENGQRIIWGWFATEQEAYSKGYSELSGRFDVVALNTIDRRRASVQLRAKFADEVGVGPALQYRFKHKVTG